MCNKYKLSSLTVCLSELFTWFEIQFDHMLMLEDLRGDHETTVWDVLISAEPLVQQIVGQVITAVSQLTARMLPVQPTVEVGQSPALGEDGAGQVRPAVVEIPRIVNFVQKRVQKEYSQFT